MGQLHFNGLLVMLVLAITAASAQSNSSSGQCDPTGPRVFCGTSRLEAGPQLAPSYQASYKRFPDPACQSMPARARADCLNAA